MEKAGIFPKILLALLALYAIDLSGQQAVEWKDLATQEIEQQLLGADDFLYNGCIYLPSHPRVEGHPYYPTEEWTKGLVYMGAKAWEIERLKLDVEINALVINAFIANQGAVDIQLNTNFVDSFRIDNQCFVNLRTLDSHLDPVFYEQIYVGSFVFLRQLKKTFIPTYNASTPRGKYAQLAFKLYVFKEGVLRELKNERALFQFFSTRKGVIKNYLKVNETIYPMTNTEELQQLLKICDE